MVHLNLICDHIVAFKRVQDGSNRLSYLRETDVKGREKDVSSMEVGLKITFPVISSKPEVATMIHSHLICGHFSVFKRVLICRNRFSHL